MAGLVVKDSNNVIKSELTEYNNISKGANALTDKITFIFNEITGVLLTYPRIEPCKRMLINNL